MNKLANFLGGVALFVAITILSGWVLTFLWKWFVVPLGVTKIGIAWAIGITIVVRVLTLRQNLEEVTTDSFIERLVTAAIVPLLVLLMGWIVHQFM